ncbi:MAG: glycogen synthase [Planctomycetota bacterium]
MKVVMATSEMVPFAKTGGLADVSGALPKYLEQNGVEVCVFMPLYKKVKDKNIALTDTGIRVDVKLDETVRTAKIFESPLPGGKGKVYFVANDESFDREELYGTPYGDYPDNAARFVLFSRAVIEAVIRMDMHVDVFHVHDWQTALIPVYLKTIYSGKVKGDPGVLMTIHNLAYQGVFWHWDMKITGLSWELFNWRQLEFFGKLNFLKGGIVFADAINTVSPTYAKEIQTSEYGCGLQEVLRYRSDKLFGIINGIDYSEWDPSLDEHIYCKFGPDNLNNKGRNKNSLRKDMGLDVKAKVPLIGMISRLADQKGLDIIAEMLDELLAEDVQMVFLGTGEKSYQDMLSDFERRYPNKVSANIMFNNTLAHRIEAGSDIFLMPSRYEPCGLNQLYSLRYGTLPIVRRTGGLADTIVDATPANIEAGTATGFVFDDYSSKALLDTCRRALKLYSNRMVWQKMVRTAMAQDWSWDNSARQYAELYNEIRSWKER